MKLSLTSKDDKLAKLAAEGRITSEDFRSGGPNPIEQLVGSDWASTRILLNLDKTTFIDSSAIGWLLTCNKECKKKGGLLVLHSIPPTVAQVFHMLKIGSILAMAPTASDAEALALAAAPAGGAAGEKQ